MIKRTFSNFWESKLRIKRPNIQGKHRVNEANNMSPSVRKHTFGQVRPVKIQISLRIHTVWSESSPHVFSMAKDAKFLRAANKDS